MVSAAHFLTAYIGLELLSLSLYAMIALRRDSGRSAEAALKYFVLGRASFRSVALRYFDGVRRDAFARLRHCFGIVL